MVSFKWRWNRQFLKHELNKGGVGSHDFGLSCGAPVQKSFMSIGDSGFFSSSLFVISFERAWCLHAEQRRPIATKLHRNSIFNHLNQYSSC
jgi:hypothetical protein